MDGEGQGTGGPSGRGARGGPALQVGGHRPPLQPESWTRYVVPLMLALLAVSVLAGKSRPAQSGIGESAVADATRAYVPLAATLLAVLLWAACGGGGGGGSPPPQDRGTPAGTYTLTLTATAGGVSKTSSLTLKVN